MALGGTTENMYCGGNSYANIVLMLFLIVVDDIVGKRTLISEA